MKTLIINNVRGLVLDPEGMTFDQKFMSEISQTVEIPDETTDWIFDRFSMRLYYVVDGKINSIFIYGQCESERRKA